MHLVGPTELAAMDLLNGREAKPNLWRRTVYQEDTWYCTAADGEQFPINPNDCEDVTNEPVADVKRNQILSKSTKAPPTINKILLVSICIISA